MKQNFFRIGFMALMSATLLISCGEDDKDKEDEVVVIPEIKLSSPEHRASFNMADAANELGINFTWEKDAQVSDYLFELSTEETFETTVASVSGNQSEYLWTMGEIETQMVALAVDYEQLKVFYWRVRSSRIDQEVTTSVRSISVTRRQHPPKYGEWLFEDFGNLGKATIGTDLELNTQGTYSQVDGPVAGDMALSVYGDLCQVTVWHGIEPVAPNKFVHEYTVLWDVNFTLSGVFIMMRQPEEAGESPTGTPNHFFAIQRPGNNPDDASHISGVGVMYSSTASDTLDNHSVAGYPTCPYVGNPYPTGYFFGTNVWHRLVFRFKAGEEMSAWTDGEIRGYATDITPLAPETSMWNLGPRFTMFVNSGGGDFQQTKEAKVARIAIWDYALSADEIKALGNAGDPTDIGQ
jgi:hypothetical protein